MHSAIKFKATTRQASLTFNVVGAGILWHNRSLQFMTDSKVDQRVRWWRGLVKLLLVNGVIRVHGTSEIKVARISSYRRRSSIRFLDFYHS
jgi:hypothetical protein